MNKKVGLLIGFLVIFSIFSALMVSAQSEFSPITLLRELIDDVSVNLDPILRYIVGDVTDSQGNTSSSEILFVKVLFLIILIAIIYKAVEHTPTIGENKAVSWVITIIASLLAVRLITTDALVNFLWTPTGVLGVALITILPFIIFFFFIEGFNESIVRKIGWMVFAVVYFLMGLLRWNELKLNPADYGSVAIDQGYDWLPLILNLSWIYMIIGILAVIIFIYDSRVRAKYVASSIKSGMKESDAIELARLEDELREVRRLRARTTNKETSKNLLAREKKIMDHIEELVGS